MPNLWSLWTFKVQFLTEFNAKSGLKYWKAHKTLWSILLLDNQEGTISNLANWHVLIRCQLVLKLLNHLEPQQMYKDFRSNPVYSVLFQDIPINFAVLLQFRFPSSTRIFLCDNCPVNRYRNAPGKEEQQQRSVDPTKRKPPIQIVTKS